MRQNTALALILVLGILARITLWSIVPVTGDAVYHYSIARSLASLPPLNAFDYSTGGDPMWYPPMFHISSHLFYLLLGSEKLAPLFFSVLSLIAFYILLKRFYPNFIVTGMTLAAFLPVQMYYGAIGYVESLLFLLAPMIFYFYFRFLEENRLKYLTASLLISSASFLTHYQGFIPLAAIATHLFFRNKKLALTFLAVGLVLVAPWYARNYIAFGNPIWPLLFDGKYSVHEGYEASSIVNVVSLSKWKAMFFEYWIGAPNSGEDLTRNVDTAAKYMPFAMLFYALWLVLVIALSILSLLGLRKLLKEDKRGSFFKIIILLSLIPILLSNFVRMFVFVFPILILGLSRIIEGFASKFRIASFVLNVSSMILPAARKVNALKNAVEWIVVLVLVIAISSPPFAYALVYRNIINDYTPFYEMVNKNLPESAVVCNMMDDVFYNNVNRKIVSIGTVPEYRVTLNCLKSEGNKSDCFEKFGVEYVCCTSLRIPKIGGTAEEFCNSMKESKPDVEYEKEGVWGRCWEVKQQ